MIEQALYHKSGSEYCYAVDEKTVRLRFRTAKEDNPRVVVIYGVKYNFATTRYQEDMTLCYTDSMFNYYCVELKLRDPRLIYIFQIFDYQDVYYFSADGLTKKFDFSNCHFSVFQIGYINPCDIHRAVGWMQRARFYQIFVDRFCCGDRNKDLSYVNLKCGQSPNYQSFAGGDLKGIIEKLPYLQDLGINALYLTPIFKSDSNHKYDVQDYFSVDKNFGSKEDFAALVEKAHEKGIKVVLDAVFNHVSNHSPQFLDVVKNGKNSQYYDWFVINGDKPDEKKLNYQCFAACGYMPKWNTSNVKVQDFLLSIGLYWIKNYHIDGWRLDVSDEVSHTFWRRFRQAVKAENPNCVIIGENWLNANEYLQGDQFDSVMNYAFTKACLDFFAFGTLDASGFADKLNEILMRNTDTVNSMMLNLLDSHDTPRFFTQVGKDQNKLKSALAVLYLYVGTPCIYYGTEIAMPGGIDPDCRRVMNWEKVESERAKDNSVWNLIHYLTDLKKNESALSSSQVKIYAKDNIFYLERGDITLQIDGATYKHTISR